MSQSSLMIETELSDFHKRELASMLKLAHDIHDQLASLELRADWFKILLYQKYTRAREIPPVETFDQIRELSTLLKELTGDSPFLPLSEIRPPEPFIEDSDESEAAEADISASSSDP